MAILPAIRERIRHLDFTLPLREPRLLRDVMLETMAAMQLTTGMMTVFGILGLVLAAVGIYGVMAYSVTQRHRELGIRLALGARPWNVVVIVMRQGLASAMWGVGIGLAGGFLLTRAMAGIMYGVGDRSLAVMAGVPAVIGLVALAACWIPARAVTSVDPIAALRQD
jgi:putative ABC transport system permease protein